MSAEAQRPAKIGFRLAMLGFSAWIYVLREMGPLGQVQGCLGRLVQLLVLCVFVALLFGFLLLIEGFCLD